MNALSFGAGPNRRWSRRGAIHPQPDRRLFAPAPLASRPRPGSDGRALESATGGRTPDHRGSWSWARGSRVPPR